MKEKHFFDKGLIKALSEEGYTKEVNPKGVVYYTKEEKGNYISSLFSDKDKICVLISKKINGKCIVVNFVKFLKTLYYQLDKSRIDRIINKTIVRHSSTILKEEL